MMEEESFINTFQKSVFVFCENTSMPHTGFMTIFENMFVAVNP